MTYFRSATNNDNHSPAFREGCRLALTAAQAAAWGRLCARGIILRVELPELPTSPDWLSGVQVESVELPAELVEHANATALECDEAGELAPGKAYATALAAAIAYARPDQRIIGVAPGWFRLYCDGQVEEVETFDYQGVVEDDTDGRCAALPDLRP